MPLRKKKHLDGVEPNSSKENSPVLRRRQVVRGRVPPDDSSSFETDEDFEKVIKTNSIGLLCTSIDGLVRKL